jgi:hypothetical protein
MIFFHKRTNDCPYSIVSQLADKYQRDPQTPQRNKRVENRPSRKRRLWLSVFKEDIQYRFSYSYYFSHFYFSPVLKDSVDKCIIFCLNPARYLRDKRILIRLPSIALSLYPVLPSAGAQPGRTSQHAQDGRQEA